MNEHYASLLGIQASVRDQIQDDPLGAALTANLAEYIREKEIPPGIYAGWDPAKTHDASALVLLSQGVPSLEDRNPKLLCRSLKDLSVYPDGRKGVDYWEQADKIIALDSRYKITKLCVDVTRDEFIGEYLRKYFRHRVELVKFNLARKQVWIQTLRVMFQSQRLLLNPKNSLYSILRTELYSLNPNTLKHPDGGSDDFVWALTLAIQATNVGIVQSSVQSGFSDTRLL